MSVRHLTPCYFQLIVEHQWSNRDVVCDDGTGAPTSWGPEKPIHFHTCFAEANITNNSFFRYLLSESEPGAEKESMFARWLHCQLQLAGGFNSS